MNNSFCEKYFIFYGYNKKKIEISDSIDVLTENIDNVFVDEHGIFLLKSFNDMLRIKQCIKDCDLTIRTHYTFKDIDNENKESFYVIKQYPNNVYPFNKFKAVNLEDIIKKTNNNIEVNNIETIKIICDDITVLDMICNQGQCIKIITGYRGGYGMDSEALCWVQEKLNEI